MTPQMTSKLPADRKRALRLAGALIGLAVVLGACKHTDDEVVDRERSRRLPPASSDRGPGSRPIDRGFRRPRPRRAFRLPARRRDGNGADLAPGGHRRHQHRYAGQHAERAGGREIVAGNPGDAGCRRRAAARGQRPPVSSRRSAA